MVSIWFDHGPIKSNQQRAAHFAAGLQESSADEPQPDIEIPA